MQRQHKHRSSPVLTLTENVPDSSDDLSAAVGTGHLCITQASTKCNTKTKQKTDVHTLSDYDPAEGPSNMLLKQHPLPVISSGTQNRRKEREREVTFSLLHLGVDARGDVGETIYDPAETCRNHQSSSPHSYVSSHNSFISENHNIDVCFAIQWNLRGLRKNLNELKLITKEYDPVIIALQETKVDARIVPTDLIGTNYKLLLRTGNMSHWQHGVGLAIRTGMPCECVQTSSELQVIAIRIKYPIAITVVSLYIPPNTSRCQKLLNDLLDDLTGPVIILGDFNAHHPAWGSKSADSLGRFIAEKSLTKNLVIINSGCSTRIDPGTGFATAIDVTLCSESVVNRFVWATLPDLHSSDHFPIAVGLTDWSQCTRKHRKWLYEQADWRLYEELTRNTIRPEEEIHLEHFMQQIIAAATSSIPRTSGKIGPKAVPWWNVEVKAVIKKRRKFLRILRRTSQNDPHRQEALSDFKEARSAAQIAIKKAKKQSWEKLIDTISPSSTMKQLWHTINLLRGKRHHDATVLKLANGYTDNPEIIAEELAIHYSERSATYSYLPAFQKDKEKTERTGIGFSPETNDYYNSDFSLSELLWALDKGHSTATGPDLIGYPMLQRLPISIKTVLLGIYNKIWSSGELPTAWRTGIIIPIPKPNTNDSGPAAFRPITLTSCVAKTFERMVNRRLTCELERNGHIDGRQHAFRAGHGTDTYFTELDKLLPKNDEHCLIASLDLCKAYDTTWRYGILRTLTEWRIKGRMYNTLLNFLSERTFKVGIGGHLTRSYPLENGMPQGSVLSATLFLVAMQPVFRVISNAVNILLYADDILLVAKSKKEEPLQMKLQRAVNAVNKWANSVGFQISTAKSQVFYCSPNVRREPAKEITLNRAAIPRTNMLKILGVTIDRSLKFNAHCKQTKKTCDLRLRILKLIGMRLHRGNWISLLQIGSAVITSRLIYGAGLITRSNNMSILAPIYNKMVRYSSGAFVTSPIYSVMAEAGILPFDLLIFQNTLRLAIRMQEKNSSHVLFPLLLRATQIMETLTTTILPNICPIERVRDREWNQKCPSIVWDVKQYARAGDPPHKVKPIVQETIKRHFNQCTIVYTDGSKTDAAVGAGIFRENLPSSINLPKQCSIFSAEAFAIKQAITTHTVTTPLAIMTDSASCLSALESGESRHPWIQQIETLCQNKRVYFCWIPGHSGITGNENADQLARTARSAPPINISVPAGDAILATKHAIRKHWNYKWASLQEVKLRAIKNTTMSWKDTNNVADQRILTRLRIGHTRLTHSFLLKKENPPECECCGVTIDVRHILIECRKYQDIRKTNGLETKTIREILSNDEATESKLIQYLKQTKLYNDL